MLVNTTLAYSWSVADPHREQQGVSFRGNNAHMSSSLTLLLADPGAENQPLGCAFDFIIE